MVILVAELFLKHPRLDMNRGKTALHHACVGSCVGLVRRLVNKAGVEVNAKDSTGQTLLMAAVEDYAEKEERRREVVMLIEEVKGIGC